MRFLFRCHHACIVLSGPPRKIGGELYKPDGLTECLNICEFNSLQAVKNYLSANLPIFTAPKGCGVVLFLYSVVLTRGMSNIEVDRDDPTATLIGQHSYCTQEMVNLVLSGRARSNVFNGERDMDGSMLRGIDKRCSVGFLSLFEHYEYIEVGSHLKTPEYPIWVICSESHYTVIFGLEKKLVDSTGVFDLYYYDELANQEEEIRLTIGTLAARNHGGRCARFCYRFVLTLPCCTLNVFAFAVCFRYHQEDVAEER